MYYLLIFVHVIACLFLIITILLQAGRGGGLAEAFTGQAQSVLGTQAPTLLKKLTEIAAIIFLLVSLILAVYTARMGRSLFQGSDLPTMNTGAMPVAADAGTASGNTGESAVNVAEPAGKVQGTAAEMPAGTPSKEAVPEQI